MSENQTIDISEQNDIPQDTAEVKEAEVGNTPKVEIKDGKTFLNGVRVHTRDETNVIASRARQEYENKLKQELEVDDLNQVKALLKSVRESSPEGMNTLNIEQLKDTVKRKEQTVEELQSKLSNLEKQVVLEKHLTKIYSNMNASWTDGQKNILVELMNTRNWLQVDGDQFAIKNGEHFFTTDGETPDYKGAIDYLAKELGYTNTRQGVELPASGKAQAKEDVSNKAYDPATKDAKLRSAYVFLRSQSSNATRNITEAEVRAQAAKMEYNPGLTLQGASALRGVVSNTPTAKTK